MEERIWPRVMIGAHLDEVGFIVTDITSRGMIRVSPVGDWNPYTVSAQRFTLFTRVQHYPVVSSAVSPHLLREGGVNGAPKITDILFDGGFIDRNDAKSLNCLVNL